MPFNGDAIDLTWSADGDFVVSEDGDIAANDLDYIQSLIDLVFTELSSAKGDWQEHPDLGAGLDDYIGEPNSRNTGKELRARVMNALTQPNLIPPGNVEVNIIPVSIHQVLVALKITAIGTPNNSITNNEIILSLIFDFIEREVMLTDAYALPNSIGEV